jgi:hypothetical protein
MDFEIKKNLEGVRASPLGRGHTRCVLKSFVKRGERGIAQIVGNFKHDQIPLLRIGQYRHRPPGPDNY